MAEEGSFNYNKPRRGDMLVEDGIFMLISLVEATLLLNSYFNKILSE